MSQTTGQTQDLPPRVLKPGAYRWTNQAQSMLHLPATSRTSLGFNIRQNDNFTALTGHLGRLSRELLGMILEDLDLESVESVRRVNTYFWNVVQYFPPYKNLKSHANETLRVIRATGIAKELNISLLYRELRQPSCRTCGDFGPYIFLLFCVRCCYDCLVTRVEFAVAPPSIVQEVCNLSGDEVQGIPTLRSLPGSYGSAYFFPHPQPLVISSLWEGMAVEYNERGVSLPIGIVPSVSRHLVWRYIRVPCLESEGECNCSEADIVDGGSLFHIFKSTARDLEISTGDDFPDYRLMASTAFPYFDPEKQRAETGLYCTACRYDWEEHESSNVTSIGGPLENNYHRAYDEAGIKKHFGECAAVRELEGAFGILGHREAFPFRRAGKDFLLDSDAAVGDQQSGESQENSNAGPETQSQVLPN